MALSTEAAVLTSNDSKAKAVFNDDTIAKVFIQPEQAMLLAPELQDIATDVYVYRYQHLETGWILSVATLGAPNSGSLSLGGFRIAPEERANLADYDNDREAILLATGMEEKIEWSKKVCIGGPLGIENLDRLIGGKCVLMPGPDARMGQPRDFEVLDFAIHCLRDIEASAGISITTGQDLGHGLMSDGKTTSLQYMYDQFHGCTICNTAKPTAEGNWQVVRGLLRALDIDLSQSKIGLIGCGNIGRYMLEKMIAAGAEVIVMEARTDVCDELNARGIQAWLPRDKADFLAQPMDVLTVNGNGNSLDEAAVNVLVENARLKSICGSENLMFCDEKLMDVLQQQNKIVCPSEYCGMMGFIAAIEEYLLRQLNQLLRVEDMYKVASKLEVSAYVAAQIVLSSQNRVSFSAAING
jgi:NAD binding domain of 6-phosphogluconate dehydrogenase